MTVDRLPVLSCHVLSGSIRPSLPSSSLLIEGIVYSRMANSIFNDMSKRIESGPVHAPSPMGSTATLSSAPTSTAGAPHPHQHSSHLAPPLLPTSGHAHHHATPPSMLSPEPSPQASGTSASMHSSPSPRGAAAGTGGAGSIHPNHLGLPSSGVHNVAPGASPHAHTSPNAHHPSINMSQSELLDSFRNSQVGQRRLQEALSMPGMLSPSLLAKLFPLTWGRCMTGSGARYEGVWAVGVGEGHGVDIKACARDLPAREARRAAAAAGKFAELSAASGSGSASGSVSPPIKQEEHEEGEAEEDPDQNQDRDQDENENDYTIDLDDTDGVYKDHEGARWCWPFVSGDSAAHVAGFGKSLIWELARAELGAGSSSSEKGAPTGGERSGPYRGAEGVNTVY